MRHGFELDHNAAPALAVADVEGCAIRCNSESTKSARSNGGHAPEIVDQPYAFRAALFGVN